MAALSVRSAFLAQRRRLPTIPMPRFLLSQCGSLSVVKSRVLGSVSSGSVVLYEVRDHPAS